MSCKTVQYFSSNLAHRQINRQTNAAKNITSLPEVIKLKLSAEKLTLLC